MRVSAKRKENDDYDGINKDATEEEAELTLDPEEEGRVGGSRTGRDLGVSFGPSGAGSLGHLAHTRGSPDGRTIVRRHGEGIRQGGDDRDCDLAEGVGNPCPRATRCPGRPQGIA